MKKSEQCETQAGYHENRLWGAFDVIAPYAHSDNDYVLLKRLEIFRG